jgi:Skp family chaperone for outer membrane proteins
MTINKQNLGWLVAAALGGVLATGALSGFQGNTAPKFAYADMNKIYSGSGLETDNTGKFDAAQKVRNEVLNFINANRAMETKDAQRFSDLSTKATALTPAETAELTKIRTSAEATTQKQRELSTKNPLTDAEKAQLTDFGAKAQANSVLLQSLRAGYENDLQNLGGDLREKTLERVQVVVRDLAAKQGYTVVFTNNSAVYAASDLTDDALKVLKKK